MCHCLLAAGPHEKLQKMNINQVFLSYWSFTQFCPYFYIHLFSYLASPPLSVSLLSFYSLSPLDSTFHTLVKFRFLWIRKTTQLEIIPSVFRKVKEKPALIITGGVVLPISLGLCWSHCFLWLVISNKFSNTCRTPWLCWKRRHWNTLPFGCYTWMRQKLLEAVRLSFQVLFSEQSHTSFGRCQAPSSVALSLANGVWRQQKDLTGTGTAPA